MMDLFGPAQTSTCFLDRHRFCKHDTSLQET
jgi:hypothetical protein